MFQATVLVQPFLWMWLYKSKHQFKEAYADYFYLLSTIFIMVLIMTGYHIGYYRTHLLIQYTIYTVLAVYLYNQRFSFKEALCLGFLTAYVNSFYWEAPLHLAEILSGVLHAGMIVQFAHLIPVPFLVNNFKWRDPPGPAYLALGLSVSVAVMYLNMFLFRPGIIRISLFTVNRLVCLIILVKTIYESEVKI